MVGVDLSVFRVEGVNLLFSGLLFLILEVLPEFKRLSYLPAFRLNCRSFEVGGIGKRVAIAACE